MVAMKEQYSICFRPNTGSCGVEFRVDTGTTTPNPFCLPSGFAPDQTTASTTAPCTTNPGSRNGMCDTAGITFPGFQSSDDSGDKHKMFNFLCGTALAPVRAVTTSTSVFNKGFIINVIGLSATTVLGANGFKLNFQQTCQ